MTANGFSSKYRHTLVWPPRIFSASSFEQLNTIGTDWLYTLPKKKNEIISYYYEADKSSLVVNEKVQFLRQIIKSEWSTQILWFSLYIIDI